MKLRILLLSLIITTICNIVFTFVAAQVYYKTSASMTQKHFRVQMNMFDLQKYPLTNEGATLFSAVLEGARVTFIDSNGTVIADSMADKITENHSGRQEVDDAILSGDGFAVRPSHTLGENMVYYCRDMGDGLLVRIASPTYSVWHIFFEMIPTLAKYITVNIFLCVLISFASTHFILGPVQQLADDAAHSDNVSSKYHELLPLAEILNERSRNINAQIAEIRREKEAAENAQMTKDEFITNVTHEMNTPLTSIRGYAELLYVGGDAMNKEQKGDACKTIMFQSDRLSNLVASIIDYSQIDSEEPSSTKEDFSEIAHEILASLRPEACKNGIMLEEDIKDNVLLFSHRRFLEALLGNLVRNAIRYNKAGGSVSVTLDKFHLVVADTGIGIAPENIDRIFDRFFTVNRSHDGKNGGFGLGLAVVKKICRKSLWKISVKSQKGQGSIFTVEF